MDYVEISVDKHLSGALRFNHQNNWIRGLELWRLSCSELLTS